MHTAEHILNQTMDHMFACGRDFRAHIESKKSKCDYHFTRELTPEEIATIQSKINQIIDSNLVVEESYVSREEADALYNTAKLPDSVRGDIRIVKIGDYDTCPCIGPHADCTGELGVFEIASTEYDDGVLRIRFKLNTESPA
jgi:misacylated tRNA(Ala) deacylase